MNQKENLDHDACTILSDFAENYQYVIQDRFQSFHWNNSQGSIHPAARYYRDMSIYYKNETGYKRMSDDNKFASIFAFNKAKNSKINFESISANEYVEFYYDSYW